MSKPKTLDDTPGQVLQSSRRGSLLQVFITAVEPEMESNAYIYYNLVVRVELEELKDFERVFNLKNSDLTLRTPFPKVTPRIRWCCHNGGAPVFL